MSTTAPTRPALRYHGGKWRIAFRLEIAPQTLQTSGKRIRIIPNKRKPGRFLPMHFKSKEAQAYENSLATLCLPHRPARPLEGPIHLGLIFVMPRPQRLCRQKDPAGRLWCYDNTPDSTNLKKAAEDILSAVGFWLNDKQVCSDRVVRKYAAKNERPCIEVVIQTIPDAVPQGTLAL